MLVTRYLSSARHWRLSALSGTYSKKGWCVIFCDVSLRPPCCIFACSMSDGESCWFFISFVWREGADHNPFFFINQGFMNVKEDFENRVAYIKKCLPFILLSQNFLRKYWDVMTPNDASARTHIRIFTGMEKGVYKRLENRTMASCVWSEYLCVWFLYLLVPGFFLGRFVKDPSSVFSRWPHQNRRFSKDFRDG